MNMTITAADLRTKGISYLDSLITDNDEAIITVRGKKKYFIRKIKESDCQMSPELEKAWKEAQEDIAAGRYYSDGAEAHIKRIMECIN